MTRSSWPVDWSLIFPVVIQEQLAWSVAPLWSWRLRCDLFWCLLNRGACKFQLPDWWLEQLVQGPPGRLFLGHLPRCLRAGVKFDDLIEQRLKVSSAVWEADVAVGGSVTATAGGAFGGLPWPTFRPVSAWHGRDSAVGPSWLWTSTSSFPFVHREKYSIVPRPFVILSRLSINIGNLEANECFWKDKRLLLFYLLEKMRITYS